MEQSLSTLARELSGWLSLALAVIGLAVSLLALGRTRWAWPLAAGFALQSLLGLFYRLVNPLMSRGLVDPGGFQAALALTSFLGALAMAGIVTGVGGLLSESKARG